MKPHEEKWFGEGSDVRLPNGIISVWLDGERASAREDAVIRLIAAAPDMARAILGVGRHYTNGWHLYGCVGGDTSQECDKQCTDAMGALRKAGVL